MIRDVERFREWEKEYQRKEKPDFFDNLRIVEALYQEARLLGVFPAGDPLQGIEDKIRLARALNVPGIAGETRSGA